MLANEHVVSVDLFQQDSVRVVRVNGVGGLHILIRDGSAPLAFCFGHVDGGSKENNDK